MTTQNPASQFTPGIHDSDAEVVQLASAVRPTPNNNRSGFRPVATRAGFASKPPSDGKRPSSTTRAYEIIAAPGLLSRVKVAYSNVSRTTTGNVTEADNANTLTIRGSIEINPANPYGTWPAGTAGVVILPIFVMGKRNIVLEPGGSVVSDAIDYPLVPGQAAYIRTWSSADGNGVCPVNRQVSNAVSEWTNNTYFPQTIPLSGTTAANTFTGTLTGVTLPLVSVGLSGGTITNGPIFDTAGAFPVGNGIAAGSTINLSTGAFTINTTTAMAPNALQFRGYQNGNITPTDETMTTGSVSGLNTNAAVFAHSDVFGELAGTETAPPFGILLIGDSIAYGLAASQDGQTSWVDYAVGTYVGRSKLACSSETAADFANIVTRHRRMRMAAGVYDHIIETYGANDFGANVSLATLQATKLSLWSALAARMPNGYRDIWVATLLPRVTSAGSTTAFNASYASGASSRNLYNAWLYTQVGITIGGVIDIAAAVENAPNSAGGNGDGLWKATNLTADGTHPSTLGYQTIAALVGVNGSNPSAAFRR